MTVPKGIYPKLDVAKVRREHPNRNPEMDVYEALARDLSGEFLILYNCNWADPSPQKMLNRDGEADFIVAHPQFGFICLEVKGGDVFREQETRQWYRRIGNGLKTITDPVEQARRSKHVIFDLVKEKWNGSFPVLRIKHAVVLPNAGRPKGKERLGGDMPLDIFAFFEDMRELGGRVIEILLKEPSGNKPTYGRLDDQGLQIIFDLFQRELSFPISLHSELDHYDRRLENLTDEQKEILELTDGQRRLLVKGGAGSGKTFLAYKKAELFAARGLSTLFLVFNSALAAHLKNNVSPSPNLLIATFHDFCVHMCKQGNVPIPDAGQREANFFAEQLPKLMLKALDAREDIRFDALVVDEGQDFQENWWDAIFLALKDFQTANISIFMDDNQNIYGAATAAAAALGVEPLFLTKNVRNTQSIFRTALPFYEGRTKRSIAPEGPGVRYLSRKSSQQAEAVLEELQRLINVEGVAPNQIAVLSMCALARSVVDGSTIGSLGPVVADDPQAASHLIHDSVWRFKGLERRIVILTDLEKFSDNRELLYVALSRARTLLVVVTDQLATGKLQSFIAARS
jgi:hypothetical protein